MRRLGSSTSLHTTRRFLWFARQLQSRRWRRRRGASEATRGCGPHVLHITRRWRARYVLATRRSATFACRGWRRPARQPTIHGWWWTHWNRRPWHVPFDRYVCCRWNISRPSCALDFCTPTHPPRRRRKPIRYWRGRRRAEPFRRRHAERAHSRETLAGGARVLLAHGARSTGPAAARAPFCRYRNVSHAE